MLMSINVFLLDADFSIYSINIKLTLNIFILAKRESSSRKYWNIPVKHRTGDLS